MTAATTTEAAPARPRGRRWWLIGGAAVAVLALLAGGITYLVRRGGEPAGTRYEVASLTSLAADQRLPGGVVQITSGRLEVDAGVPLRELPDPTPIDVDREEPGRVGGFGRWVGVEWRFGIPPDPDRLFDPARRQPLQFEVVLVADGVRHDLAAGETEDPNRAEGYVRHKALYVALPGDPGTLTLEVAYDGVTQTLDLRTGKVEAGVAAPLYARTRWTATSKPCTDDEVTIKAPGFAADRDDVEVECTLNQVAIGTPYLPGRGWAKPGRVWVTFQLRTQAGLAFVRWPSLADPDPALYRLQLRSTAVTAAGTAPALTTSYYQQGLEEQQAQNLMGAYFSFDVPAGATSRVSVHQDYVSRTADRRPGAPETARGTVDFAIDLRSA